MIDLTHEEGALSFNVRVVPRASQSEMAGEHDGALKVRIASAPVDGAANAELIKFLAKQFRVSRGDIEIVGGHKSKNKRIKISNLSQSNFERIMK